MHPTRKSSSCCRQVYYLRHSNTIGHLSKRVPVFNQGAIARFILQMAAALITVLIPLVFFLFLGRYFIRGILAGALKG